MDGINKFKKENMKRTFALFVLMIAMVSCYDDYIKDYNYNSVYFPYQIDVRTFVVGEGMKIEVGASLGGIVENKTDRNVEFTIDNSFITPARLTAMRSAATYIKNSVPASIVSLQPLPQNYYSLSSNNTIVIRSGEHTGAISMKADSAAFLSDPLTINAAYVLSLYITKADADTIVEPKRFAVIGLKYENMLFGKYWHGGVTVEKDAAGNVVRRLEYYTAIPQPEAKTWELRTIAPDRLAVKGFSGTASNKDELILALNGNDITLSSAAGSTYSFSTDGACTFNRPKLLQNRKLFLNYKYVNAAGNTCYATDTLTFRNRIRDGVNEWQDENPSHYTK